MKKLKSQFQDIIPAERRSIRNIPLSNHVEETSRPDSSIKEKTHSHTPNVPREEESFDRWRETPYEDELVFTGSRKVGGLSKLTLWVLTLVCATVLFLSVTYFFTSAVIKIESKKFVKDMPQTLTLSLAPEEGQVGYSVVSLSDSLSETVDATGEKEVSAKAQGTIIVYNAFDSNSQKFIEGTRFETPKGLIYKTTKAITVPGKKVVSGKDVPGSIEVVVMAEKAGSEYNIELSDFNIPGLKGDARFDKFYGRSKTNMSGGESGKVAVVSDADMSKTVDSLKEKLGLTLKEKLEKELPESQVLFTNLSVLDYSVSSPKLQDGKAIIEVTGNIRAYVLDSNTLAQFLFKDDSIEIKESDTFVVNSDEVQAEITDGSINPPAIKFGGKVSVQYVFDEEKFKTDIAGIEEDQIPEISKSYSGISKISATIKPFWKNRIPKDTGRITIEEL